MLAIKNKKTKRKEKGKEEISCLVLKNEEIKTAKDSFLFWKTKYLELKNNGDIVTEISFRFIKRKKPRRWYNFLLRNDPENNVYYLKGNFTLEFQEEGSLVNLQEITEDTIWVHVTETQQKKFFKEIPRDKNGFRITPAQIYRGKNIIEILPLDIISISFSEKK